MKERNVSYDRREWGFKIMRKGTEQQIFDCSGMEPAGLKRDDIADNVKEDKTPCIHEIMNIETVFRWDVQQIKKNDRGRGDNHSSNHITAQCDDQYGDKMKNCNIDQSNSFCEPYTNECNKQL